MSAMKEALLEKAKAYQKKNMPTLPKSKKTFTEIFEEMATEDKPFILDQSMLDDEEMQRIYTRAQNAASQATADYLAQYGDGYPCGFAWVNMSQARSRFARWLKNNGHASKGTYKGLTIYNPSGNPTQNIDAKFAGAEAFVAVLKEEGIVDVYASSRLD